MAERPIRLAVIGLGMASKPHLSALHQLAPNIEVAAVFARSADRRAEVSATWGWPAAQSVEAICADPAIEGAIVLTPPNARREIVASLASAGKHILMEKPVERTLAHAKEIVGLAESAGVELGMVLQHRFRSGAVALADLMTSGKLGDVHLVRVNVPWWREQSYYDQPGRGTYEVDGGGVLITQAIHVLDLMLNLTGPVRNVIALCGTTPLHSMEAEDFAVVGLRFGSGAMGSVTATTAAYPGGTESLEIDCTNAALRLVAGELTIHWRDGRTETIGEVTGTGGGSDPMDFPSDWHRDVILDFANAIRSGRPPKVSGRDALKVHRLIDAIERSAKSGTVEHPEDLE